MWRVLQVPTNVSHSLWRQFLYLHHDGLSLSFTPACISPPVPARFYHDACISPPHGHVHPHMVIGGADKRCRDACGGSQKSHGHHDASGVLALSESDTVYSLELICHGLCRQVRIRGRRGLSCCDVRWQLRRGLLAFVGSNIGLLFQWRTTTVHVYHGIFLLVAHRVRSRNQRVVFVLRHTCL